MKNIIVLLFILMVSEFSFGQEEHELKWENISNIAIPGKILTITKSNNIYYAYTKTSVFWSLDNGETWELNCNSLDREDEIVLTGRENVLVINRIKNEKIDIDDTTRETEIYEYKNLKGCYSKSYNKSSRTSFYQSDFGGSITQKDSDNLNSNFRFINDNILIHQQSNNHYDGNYIRNGGSHTKQDGQAKFIWEQDQKKHTLLMSKLDESVIAEATLFNDNYSNVFSKEGARFTPQIIGHRDSIFIAITDSFYLEMSENLDILKKIKHQGFSKDYEAYYTTQPGESVFVFDKEKNKKFTSNDGGISWQETENTIPSVQNYKFKDGIHLFYTENSIFFSADFNEFSEINDVNDIYAFGDTLLAPSVNPSVLFRSFDQGRNWEEINPKGISSKSGKIICQVNNKIYIDSKAGLFEQQDDGSFIKTDRKYNETARYSEIYVIENHIIYEKSHKYKLRKFNETKNEWEQILDDSIPYIRGIGFANNKIYITAKEKIYITDQNGKILDNLNLPPYAKLKENLFFMHKILIKDDTIILNNLSRHENFENNLEHFYTTDHGISWQRLKGTDKILNLDSIPTQESVTKIISPRAIFKDGVLYFITNKIWKYPNLDGDPIVVDKFNDMVSGNTFDDIDKFAFTLYNEHRTIHLFDAKENSTEIISKEFNFDFYPNIKIDKEKNEIYVNSEHNGVWKAPFKFCTEQNKYVGEFCDDKDVTTYNDKILSDCTCKGTIENNCRQNDSTVLAKVYTQLVGKRWKNQDNWLTSQPLDQWYGISTNENGCVTEIDLDGIDDGIYSENGTGNHLVGVFPTEINGLNHLKKINLSNNNIIKVETINNEKLEYIAIANNNLESFDISQNVNLTYLNLSNNYLEKLKYLDTGYLKLAYLNLSNNNFRSKVPLIENAPVLEYINVKNNSIKGNLTLIQKTIEWADFSKNKLDSFDINEELPILTFLDVSDNNLVGELPDLSIAPSLEHIYLKNNHFKGCFPDNYSFLCEKDFSFSNNPQLPWNGDFTHFCNEESQKGAPCLDPNLKKENGKIQSDCSCQGTYITACRSRDSTALAALYIATDGDNWIRNDNWLTTAPLNTWYGIQTIDSSCVSSINLTTLIDGNIRRWTGNNLIGKIPPELGQLKSLKALTLNHNKLEGSIPFELGALPALISLQLMGNKLEGCIPVNLKHLCKWEFSQIYHYDWFLHHGMIGYDLRSNKLPYDGNLCNDLENQIGAPCDDRNPSTENDEIQADCTCKGLLPCQRDDKKILETFYQTTNGENWLKNTNWLSSMPLDKWYGITTNEDGCVTCIDLDGVDDQEWSPEGKGNKLDGNIHRSFNKLRRLEKLHISYNKIDVWGDPIYDLPNLKYLSATNNQQNYSYDYIYHDSLVYLNLANTKSPIAFKHLSKMKNLKYLNLENSSLIDTLPDGISNLNNLEYLNISNNKLSRSIDHISSLNNLKAIYVNNNNFSSCFPDNEFFCSLGFSDNSDLNGYNFSNNSLMPWGGDFSKYCDGLIEIGAPCNDQDSTTINDGIDENCICSGTIVSTQNISNFTKLKIHPNPNNGQFTLSLKVKKKTSIKISIHSLVGKSVFMKEIPGHNLKERINLAHLPSGVYFLQISTNNEILTEKVIIE